MNRIQQKLTELTNLAHKLFPGYDFSGVQFKMNSRLTSTAGRAFLDRWSLDFSTKLYELNQEEFLLDTVTHEFAHLVAFKVYNSVGHDMYWKLVVNQLGGKANRCHQYQVEHKAQHEFKCACRSHFFSSQRYAWVKRGKQYQCKHCNQILQEV